MEQYVASLSTHSFETAAGRHYVVNLDKDLAELFVAHMAPEQRTLGAKRVAANQRLIANGYWIPIGDHIRFNEQGECFDGQHRCHALIGADAVFEDQLVLFSVHPDAALAVDNNKIRTLAHQLKFAGIPMTGGVAGAVLFAQVDFDIQRYEEQTKVERVDLLRSDDPMLVKYLQHCTAISRAEIGKTPRTGCLAAVAAAYKRNSIAATQFFDKVMANDPSSDDEETYKAVRRAVKQLNKNIGRGQPNKQKREDAYVLIRCWNAHRGGRPVTERMNLPKRLPKVRS